MENLRMGRSKHSGGSWIDDVKRAVKSYVNPKGKDTARGSAQDAAKEIMSSQERTRKEIEDATGISGK